MDELHKIIPTASGDDLDAPVTVLTVAQAKGLEFDAVAVIEPAAFRDDAVDDRSAGRLLYIALTRAVQDLVIVHTVPLPVELRS